MPQKTDDTNTNIIKNLLKIDGVIVLIQVSPTEKKIMSYDILLQLCRAEVIKQLVTRLSNIHCKVGVITV